MKLSTENDRIFYQTHKSALKSIAQSWQPRTGLALASLVRLAGKLPLIRIRMGHPKIQRLKEKASGDLFHSQCIPPPYWYYNTHMDQINYEPLNKLAGTYKIETPKSSLA
jgi:hypothetical protein